MSAPYAVRLLEAPDPALDALSPDPTTFFSHHDLFGFGDRDAAWRFAVSAVTRGTRTPVVAVPGDLGAAAFAAIAAAGGRAVAADLDGDTGSVIWTPVAHDASLVEHRLGGVRRPPQAARPGHAGAVHDLTDIMGVHAEVFSPTDFGLIRLGQPPFWRSRGVVVVAPKGTFRDGEIFDHWDADRRRRFRDDLGDALTWIEGCRAAASVYLSAFRPAHALLICAPGPAAQPRASFTTFHVLVADPEGLRARLRACEVETERPTPGPLAHATAGLPGTLAFYRRALRLPNHPNLGMAELLHVADAVRGFLEGRPGPR